MKQLSMLCLFLLENSFVITIIAFNFWHICFMFPFMHREGTFMNRFEVTNFASIYFCSF